MPLVPNQLITVLLVRTTIQDLDQTVPVIPDLLMLDNLPVFNALIYVKNVIPVSNVPNVKELTEIPVIIVIV